MGQFVWRGVLQIPPEQKLVANEDGRITILANGETMLIKVKNESGDLLGSVEYLRRPPVAYNEKVFMYFYAESVPYDGNCLFGTLNSDGSSIKGC